MADSAAHAAVEVCFVTRKLVIYSGLGGSARRPRHASKTTQVHDLQYVMRHENSQHGMTSLAFYSTDS